MKRSLLTVVLIASAALAASAEARSPVSAPQGAKQVDPLGPRTGSGTAAESYARGQIEHGGYTGVRGLTREADGSWRGMARSPSNAPVQVALDARGQVSEVR